MRCFGWGTLYLMLLCLGCAVKADPAVTAAADQIIKLGGTFVVHGFTVPIKSAAKIPTGRMSIQTVTLNGLKVRDEQIVPLQCLTQLEELHLEDSYLTDNGLVHLQGLKALQELDVHKSLYITDKGLESLKSLPRLAKLELSYTRIGDAGIDTLLTLKQLKVLHLTGTKVSPLGLKKLREGLPRCEILK